MTFKTTVRAKPLWWVEHKNKTVNVLHNFTIIPTHDDKYLASWSGAKVGKYETVELAKKACEAKLNGWLNSVCIVDVWLEPECTPERMKEQGS